jgi:hypothetical protein
MLHKNPSIIAPETFLLIQELQTLPELQNFYLVGGTALALQLAHRNSIDIDLFTQVDFDTSDLINTLKKHFLFQEASYRKNTIIGFINNIKVDFVTHPYPFVNSPLTEEGISYLSMQDIAAMKLNAIINSGQRLKDFIDIYFLLEHYSIKDILSFFEAKYQGTNPVIALKAVSYFDDIDESIDPPKLLQQLTLKKIKARIEEAVVSGDKTFGKG